jgi:hypothetical protein
MASRPDLDLQWRYMGRPATGLLASLDDLVLSAALGAICSPLLVGVAWVVAGRPIDGSATDERVPFALLALAVGVFFLAPMLALASAVTAMVVCAFVYLRRPPEGSLGRALYLVLVAVWASLIAVTFDVVIAPVLTR